MRQPLNSINPGYAGEPHLLPHGRTILYNYVGSDGWGLNNISYSLYNATTGVWSAPVQLPAPINNYVTGVGGRTAGMPFVSYDGEEFWFTGNGSLTGPSLYRSFILSGSGPEDWVFSEPQEIVKSLAGECTMAADGKYMYFVHHFVDFSTPEDFIKDVDIYRLERLIPKNNNPIFINGSDPAHDWDQCPYVTGSGTPASPYIIADVEFKGFGYGHTISIVNSNAHFEIKNCSIRKGGYILSDGGIHLQNVSNGVITRNQIYDNGNDGIFLQNCSNILIWNNTITSNENLGVRLDAMTKNCLIHNNTFISNWRYNSGLCASQGWDDGMNNRWDNGIVGNSWDNYLGTDGNGDGIGDVPYPICGSASNSDLFPYLTEPTPGTPDPPESEDPPPSQPNDPDPGQINGFCISFVVALMVITTSVRALRKTRR
jgi:parallel beta-helix repeat protein